jgi:hypothetical protein
MYRTLWNRIVTEIDLYLDIYRCIKSEPKPESIYIRACDSTEWKPL